MLLQSHVEQRWAPMREHMSAQAAQGQPGRSILFWQVLGLFQRCVRHQMKELQGRRTDAKIKSGP